MSGTGFATPFRLDDPDHYADWRRIDQSESMSLIVPLAGKGHNGEVSGIRHLDQPYGSTKGKGKGNHWGKGPTVTQGKGGPSALVLPTAAKVVALRWQRRTVCC